MEDDSQICLVPPASDIDETDGFDKSDLFNHAEFGERLVNKISRALQTPPVFALTGGWGTGKSIFAKQLRGELCKKWERAGNGRKAENAPVIYFDAFANDYQEDALFALAGEVMEFIGRQKKLAGKAGDSIARIGKGVSGTLAEYVARFATLGVAGVEDISTAMKTALDKRMEDAEEGRDVVKKFREALEKAAKELGGGQPLVFIVDELDRCRPDFALELLEKIKHLFSVPNVCFLVVANLEQFKAVVQRAYGYSEEEARVYLDKFFHHAFQLPLFDQHQTFNGKKYLSYLWEVMHFPDITNGIREYMQDIVVHHKMSLRDIEQMLACAALIRSERLGADLFKNHFDSFIIPALHALRKINPNVYRQILHRTAVWDALPQNLQESPMRRALCLTKEGMSENEKAMFREFPGIWHHINSADERRRVLASIAARIEEIR